MPSFFLCQHKKMLYLCSKCYSHKIYCHKIMNRFYDRENEILRLKDVQNQSYSDCSRFVVLTGRRRVGKTSLVHKLMEDTSDIAPCLYFFAGRKTELSLVKTFADEVRVKLGEYVPESISSFRELFQMLLEFATRQRFTLFIDEFQEFDNINPEIYSDVQELWDTYKKKTKVCLIVSGSIYRLMEKIFKDETQPLFGRDDCTINLQPFTTEVLSKILSDYNAKYTNDDLLALWTITGGVARYVEVLMNNGCTTVNKMIHNVCADGDSYFIEEARKILVLEFGKQYGTYFSILEQLAGGNVTQSQIESAIGENSLGGHLKLLEEKYGIIAKRRPIGAKPNSQSVRYYIKDNFFRFWFRYIYKYSYLIEIHNMPALEKIILDDYQTFSGVALENWFRNRMSESYRYKQIGSWWHGGKSANKKGNADDFEIDIVAVTLNDSVEVYEVKRNADKYNAERLKEKVEVMQRHIFGKNNISVAGLSLEDMQRKF